MKIITKENVLIAHNRLIEVYGGSSGIRDEALLESAISTPFQEFDGISAFPSIQGKGARLGFGLVKNHPFIDGNKRIGAHIMLTFLHLNSIYLDYTQKELWTIILDVASSKSSYDDLLNWVLKHQITD